MTTLNYDTRATATTLLRLAAKMIFGAQPSAQQILCDCWANTTSAEHDAFVLEHQGDIWNAIDRLTR